MKTHKKTQIFFHLTQTFNIRLARIAAHFPALHMNVNNFFAALGGAAVGLINGLLGGGGGMLAVPLLQKTGYAPRSAHATAIAVIAPVSLLSGIIYLAGGFVPADMLVPTLLGVLAGGFLGAKLLAIAPPRLVTFAFAAFMLFAGGRMLF